MLKVLPAWRGDRLIGRGVFATEKISSGTIIEKAHCIVLKSAKGVEDYYFEHEGTLLLALGLGSLLNHSSIPNVDYFFRGSVIEFVAVQDIEAEQELMIDYGTEYWYNRGMEVPS